MATDAVKIEKFYQDQLWVIQGFNIDRASVDAWEAAVRDYILHMQTNERYLIYDLVNVQNLGFTNYMRQRTTALAKDNPSAAGRVAIAMALNPTLRHIFEPFVQFSALQLQPRLKVKLFSSREAAFEWVSTALPIDVKIPYPERF